MNKQVEKELEAISTELRELDFQFADWSRAQTVRMRELFTRVGHVRSLLKASKKLENDGTDQ